MNKLYFNELSDIPTMSKDEQLALLFEARTGNDKAKEQLINCNLKLSVHYAKRFEKYLVGDGVITVDDLISEGNIALINAIEQYNPDSGTTISSYASVAIKRRLITFILQNNSVLKMPERLMKKLLKEANLDENLNCGGNEIIPTKSIYIDVESVENDEENEQEMQERLEIALKTLSPREELIITKYYLERMKQVEIAKLLGIGKQRVGQIIKQSIKKMKTNTGN